MEKINGWHADQFKTKTHYVDSVIHCDNGPAILYLYGSVEYVKYGKRHREDGPAIIWSDGLKEYWFEGAKIEVFSDEDFERSLKLRIFQ